MSLSQKVDFTKPYKQNPGPGQYHLPSIWEKYWFSKHGILMNNDIINLIWGMEKPQNGPIFQLQQKEKEKG